jgi:hypothetical protein
MGTYFIDLELHLTSHIIYKLFSGYFRYSKFNSYLHLAKTHGEIFH